ncbi:MAG TPA: LysM peptidoglycan-binding domain-containing protein [Anaerolineales bacterium]
MLAPALLALFVGACAPATTLPPPAATPVSPLTPYWSPTPGRTANLPARIQATSTPPPPPSPTPVTYKVAKGDTMLGIALRYGILLEDLLAANPEVDPRFLSIDTVLIIPPGEETPVALVTPTPPPLDLDDPVCYPTADGGAWCFLLVENDQPYALENISAWIGIYDLEGENVAGEVGITPLNLLPPDRSMPVVASFPPPLPERFTASSDRFSAFGVPDTGDRYLETRLTIDQVEISENGLQASLGGSVRLPARSPAAKLVWLLGVAYDAEGNVIGVRRWETGEIAGNGDAEAVIEGGDSLPFSFDVFSLGPAIERVDVLVEARP